MASNGFRVVFSGEQRPPRRPLEGILARLTGCVGYLSVTCSCAVLGALDFLSFLLPPELLILTLLPLRVTPPDR